MKVLAYAVLVPMMGGPLSIGIAFIIVQEAMAGARRLDVLDAWNQGFVYVVLAYMLLVWGFAGHGAFKVLERLGNSAR